MAIKLQLSSVPVFRFVEPGHMQKLASIAKVVEKARGEAVLIHGETVPGIYVVGEGLVGVFPPGTTRPLVQLGVGEAFGEMAFLENAKASATIRAEQSGTKLVVMLQADLANMVEADAALGQALYRGIAVALSKKLRNTTSKVAAELAAGRKLLLELAAEDESAANLATLTDDVLRQNQTVMDNLDNGIRLADELARKMPEKAGSVSAVQMKLSETRALCSQFYPRLARQIKAITSFIRSMEEFILQSTRD